MRSTAKPPSASRQPSGRNSLHGYNDQDDSMSTAILMPFNPAEGMSDDVHTEELSLEEGELVDVLLDIDLVR